MKPEWKVRLTSYKSTWYWFTTNPAGGGFGSNHSGSQRLAKVKALRGIPVGSLYELDLNGKITVEVKEK